MERHPVVCRHPRAIQQLAAAADRWQPAIPGAGWRTLAGPVRHRRGRYHASVCAAGPAPGLAAAALVRRGQLAGAGRMEHQPAAGTVSAQLPADRPVVAGPGLRAGGGRISAIDLATRWLELRPTRLAPAAYDQDGRALADAVAGGLLACQRMAGAARRQRQPRLGPLSASLDHDAGAGLADTPMPPGRLAGSPNRRMVSALSDSAGNPLGAAVNCYMEYFRRRRHGAPALSTSAQPAGLEQRLRHAAGAGHLPVAAGRCLATAGPMATAPAPGCRLPGLRLVQPDAAAHGVALSGRAV